MERLVTPLRQDLRDIDQKQKTHCVYHYTQCVLLFVRRGPGLEATLAELSVGSMAKLLVKCSVNILREKLG